ncbi:MAG: ATP synthase F0 subunit B [Chloroflexi bacterium]|nr:ATP synthase F0 subunit B [Chloroflexota bacterium]
MGLFEQLGLDPYKLATQSFNFLVLLYLLNRLAFKPVLRIFDERASRIKADLDEATRMRQEGERDRQTYRDQLNRARDEARAVLDEASNVASRVREQAMFDAEASALAIIARARQDIARERDAALKQLRGEVATIAIMAATRVVKRNLNTEDARRLVDEALTDTELASKVD